MESATGIDTHDWLLRGPNPAAWGVSTVNPGISKESVKKGLRRWREEIWDAAASSGLYSQTSLPFWRAAQPLARSPPPWIGLFISPYTNQSRAVITVWLKKASVKRKKSFFPHTYIDILMQYKWNIERGTDLYQGSNWFTPICYPWVIEILIYCELIQEQTLLNAQQSLGFTENGPKKRKYPVSGSCVDENALLMSEENWQTGSRW